jgi:hypothetical protein
MANRALSQRGSGEFLVPVAIIAGCAGFGGRLHRGRPVQQMPAPGEFLLPVTIAEEAVVANALEAVGQSVEEEPADELLPRQRHRFLPVVVSIVFPLELNLTGVEVQQAMVGDGDAVGIAAHVVENLLQSAEGGVA